MEKESDGGTEGAYLGMQLCKNSTNTMSRSSLMNPVDMDRKMMERQSAGHRQNRTRHTLAI